MVINGQLSLGQLIAAELVLAAILFGLSKATEYLKSYYEMCGAADELGKVLAIPQENIEANDKQNSSGNSLVFDRVAITYNACDYRFNFNLPQNAKTLVHAENASIQYSIIHLLKRNLHPLHGSIQLDGNDLSDFDVYKLRQDVVVVDRSPIVECTINDYLRMSKPTASSIEIRQVLDQLNILSDIEKMPQALNTLLSPLGDPLSPVSFLQLKLAAALLIEPKVLVLTQFFDMLTKRSLDKLSATLSELPLTVLFFTSLEYSAYFNHRLLLGEQSQTLFDGQDISEDTTMTSGQLTSEAVDVETL